uniref:F-box domain-containing protein n=1 Tax=Plectus sambesii TaxID=2011161 RepID=A0A914XH10_9BILA
MSMAAMETDVDKQAGIDRLRRALGDFSERIVCGQLTGKLPDNFLERFSQLPDRPLEQVLRFLPARQVVQIRHVSRRFNHLIKKCSKTMPKKGSKGLGSVLFKAIHAGELTVEWFDNNGNKIDETTLAGDEVALSELLRFIRIDGVIYFGEGLSAADEVLDQLSKAWLAIRPLVVIFAGDLSKTSRNSLRAFLMKVEPFVRQIQFQNAYNIPDSLLSDDLIDAAGPLNGLMIKPLCSDLDLCDINIGDDTLLAMADSDEVLLHFFVKGCSGITTGGIRTFIEKWLKKERPVAARKPFVLGMAMKIWKLLFYKCSNVTPAAVEKECGDLLKKEMTARVSNGEMSHQVKYTIECGNSYRRLEIFFDIDSFRLHFVKEPRPGIALGDLFDDDDDLDSEMDGDDESDDYEYDGRFYFQSMAALQAEVARLQAENDQLRRALPNIDERIVCGKSTGRLPDYSPKQFSQLPDRPLEHVLRFLPAHQVTQMRHVSRRFNYLIRKCSKTMPKKAWNGSVVFEITLTGQLTVDWFDGSSSKITATSLTGDEVALSELLRFIRISGRFYFSHGLSAADKVLDQLSKAWLTIRPDMVIFAGNLSHTSRDSLKAFLKKVEPSIRRLHFQDAYNIADSLLSDDVVDAAGRLVGLMIKPLCWRAVVPNFTIGDNTLLAMVDADHVPSYLYFMGCSGITPGGIRAFVEKWMNKWMTKGKPKAGANSTGCRHRYVCDWCKLTFYKCANVTPAAVEEACCDLVKKESTVSVYREKKNDSILYSVESNSTYRRLEIGYDSDLFFSHLVKDPRSTILVRGIPQELYFSDG